MALNLKSKNTGLWRFAALVFIVSLSLILPSLSAQEEELVSKFGKYKGYSPETYDTWVRTSQYITMRDGVKIAIDIIRPARERTVAKKPLPVIWSHNRYRRAFIRDGKVKSVADSPLYQDFLKHGYVLANADVRGSGASFGSWQGIFTPEETQDAYEINEWIATQPWCDGNVGMFGGSYLGITQLMVTSTKPPHLKAIFPIVALFDIYSISYHGGVFYDDFIKTWSELTRQLDTETVALPVDADKDKKLLQVAIEEHKSNRSLYEIFLPLKYRDSRDEYTGEQPYYKWHPAAFIQEINDSGIPMYLWCGWFDSFIKDGFLMYLNFNVPKKIAISARSHAPRDPEVAREEFSLVATEALRWFDHWLKGIENGIMDEPPIRYQVMKAPKDNKWRAAEQWPLLEQRPTKYYFSAGPSGNVASVNDGVMSIDAPSDKSGEDKYVVDYTTTTGTATRMDNAVGGGFNYPDMTENDKKALTYTTGPMSEDLEVTGHPVVHLWISSTAKDNDFFVYLEEVDAQRFSHYITEGTLRASHRALHKPYYDNLRLPYHRSHEADVIALTPGEPEELVFDMQPTSNIFDAGNRMRVTIACADKDNASTPELSPAPTVTVYRNKKIASYVSLPVVGAEEEVAGEPTLSLLTLILIALLIIVLVIAFIIFIRRRT
jgi:putative CocE/NonD family hydrolase